MQTVKYNRAAWGNLGRPQETAMESFGDFLVLASKLGIAMCILGLLTIYGAYAVESHCWNPMGCVNNSQEARDMAWAADHVNDYMKH